MSQSLKISSPPEKYDIVILGVGGMGSATLYTLAKRGLKVCGIEQFDLAHDRGSSHGETRLIRKAYFEHPDYIPLLNRAYDLWYEVEKEAGVQLFVKNGLVVAGKPNSEVIKGLDLCYEKHDLPHEKITVNEARKRFPQFHLPENFVVYYDPIAGFLHVEKSVEQFADLARGYGATLHTNEKVLNWQPKQNHISIKTDCREIVADKLIITAGAWANQEMLSLGIDFDIWRKVLFWYDSPEISNYKLGNFPSFYVELDFGGFYGFPAINPLGLKIGEHEIPGLTAQPDKLTRTLQPDDEPVVLRFFEKVFPGFQPTRTNFTVCMYTITPDFNFILDRHPENENVIIGAGFSGHGFKFAPVIGEILADLAIDGSTSHPIDFLRLTRFKKK
ncbi:N-methyl-L-tryptophan oxidase [candidate division KSB1 bacterium]|nr:N-methyl-L-tryptophan oxidase [candidate division KSB1 bacterium]